ncbi:MAG TPA: hypothetical protein VFA18_05675, partial [Gemmataceae bacterium]|nr:hypothetical protein [Gemmataceae bacterium]
MSWMQVAALAFVLLPETVLAGGGPAIPKGPPPRFAVVLSLKGQELRVREFCIQPKAHLFRTELKNGRWLTQAV